MTLICETEGLRLDLFLSGTVPGLSRSAAQNLLSSGCVTCNGEAVKKNYRTRLGDVIQVELPEPEPLDVIPTKMDLEIAYEDEDVLVINKPKGLVVHPAAGHWDDTLVNGLLYAKGESLSGINGVLRPGIVHRIDKDTSGLLAVAKNDLAHTVLASGRHPSDRKRMTITDRGKPAVTHWEAVTRYRGYTHIRCHLETGRTHQIRVHMASLGHPILGDLIYGRKKPELGQDSQCLHASTLCFRHPRTGLPVIVTAPLPRYFQEVLEKLERMGR